MANTLKDKIQAHYGKAGATARASEVALRFGVSRQAASRALNDLVAEGFFSKKGATKKAEYVRTRGHEPQPNELKLVKVLKGLNEDRVFDEIDLRANLKKNLSKNVHQIVSYAFSEMLNNAIDHSSAKKAEVHVQLDAVRFSFEIRDKGVGLFKNVQKKFTLKDEYEALEHVLKGKQTTMPERHSGQGIFFTSRIADCFEVRSHRIHLRVDNDVKDTFVKEERPLTGTLVSFSIRRRSRKALKDLFDRYTDSDFEFDQGECRVKLSQFNGLLSRSQARRLTTGLESYKRIVFDFKGVAEIGQAFADEIFRVFQNRNPSIKLEFANADNAVTFMIYRAKNSRE